VSKKWKREKVKDTNKQCRRWGSDGIRREGRIAPGPQGAKQLLVDWCRRLL